MVSVFCLSRRLDYLQSPFQLCYLCIHMGHFIWIQQRRSFLLRSCKTFCTSALRCTTAKAGHCLYFPCKIQKACIDLNSSLTMEIRTVCLIPEISRNTENGGRLLATNEQFCLEVILALWKKKSY